VTQRSHRRDFEPDKKGGHALSTACHYKVGVGHSESTPVETGTAVELEESASVSASAVEEAGSPTLTEAAAGG
jgi:hypothetical protein